MIVKLKGLLGDMFGKEYNLSVQTPIEALHALAVMIDDFKPYLDANPVCVWINGTPMDDMQELTFKNTKETELVVALPIMGAGGGSGLLGGVMKVFNVFVPIMGYLGFGLASDVLTKLFVPKMPNLSQDEDGNKASYGFGGAVTTITQGNVIPVAYGECLQGGFVLTWQVTSDITKY